MELQQKRLNKKAKNWIVNILFIFSISIISCSTLKKQSINEKNETSGEYKIYASNVNDTINDSYISLSVSYYKKKYNISALTIDLLNSSNEVIKSLKYRNISKIKIPIVDSLDGIYINDFGFKEVSGFIKISGLSYFTRSYNNIKIEAKLFEIYNISHEVVPKSEVKKLRKQIDEMKK
jgi:hypothetical protein